MAENILDSMLFALCVTEDNTVGLTIFEDREASTIYLEKKMAISLAKDIIHYARLLKES
jgi:hypothetical protein